LHYHSYHSCPPFELCVVDYASDSHNRHMKRTRFLAGSLAG
jgi:hypothetical protein